MDSELEATSYASAAAQAYLSRIDDSFVTHFLRLGVTSGTVLDVGCGPGAITIKLAHHLPYLSFVGVDLSDAMLNLAYANAQALHLPNLRFERADAKSLPYPDAAFAAVVSNSLIHHLSDPVPFFNEAARVATPNAAILFRDIRRP
ncbi:MAG: class I SAM-dependent methyltransferase, partial [bacterium]|nr:class I SAM-dependent methyltransferase [bacterium]